MRCGLRGGACAGSSGGQDEYRTAQPLLAIRLASRNEPQSRRRYALHLTPRRRKRPVRAPPTAGACRCVSRYRFDALKLFVFHRHERMLCFRLRDAISSCLRAPAARAADGAREPITFRAGPDRSSRVAHPCRSPVAVRSTMSAHFLAFDLGAESGRAMLGRLHAASCHAAGGPPVPERAGPRRTARCSGTSLRLWHEMRRGARACAADSAARRASASTPGAATTRSSASAATCSRIRITIATRAPTAMMDAVFERVSRERIYAIDRHPVPADQHALPALRGLPR